MCGMLTTIEIWFHPMRLNAALLVACAALPGQVMAAGADLPPGKAGSKGFATTCAGYGPGFVPVAGSNTCVRISGHVRVEYGWGKGSLGGAHNAEPGLSAYVPPDAAPASPDAGAVFGRLKPVGQKLPAPAKARTLLPLPPKVLP